MKGAALLMATALMTACAVQEPAEQQSTQDRVQAVRDYIDVRGLEEVGRLATAKTDNTTPLTQYYVIYKGRHETHLIEFERRCWRIEPDDRRSPNYISAVFDTYRGCRIRRILKVSEEDVAELQNIEAGVGSYN